MSFIFVTAEAQRTQRSAAATKSKESVPQRGSVWVGREWFQVRRTSHHGRPTRYRVVVLTLLPPSLENLVRKQEPKNYAELAQRYQDTVDSDMEIKQTEQITEQERSDCTQESKSTSQSLDPLSCVQSLRSCSVTP